MSPITRSGRHTIIGIARLNSWVCCMENTEAAVMASSPVARVMKLGFAHMAVDPVLFETFFVGVLTGSRSVSYEEFKKATEADLKPMRIHEGTIGAFRTEG